MCAYVLESCYVNITHPSFFRLQTIPRNFLSFRRFDWTSFHISSDGFFVTQLFCFSYPMNSITFFIMAFILLKKNFSYCNTFATQTMAIERYVEINLQNMIFMLLPGEKKTCVQKSHQNDLFAEKALNDRDGNQSPFFFRFLFAGFYLLCFVFLFSVSSSREWRKNCHSNLPPASHSNFFFFFFCIFVSFSLSVHFNVDLKRFKHLKVNIMKYFRVWRRVKLNEALGFSPSL